MPPGLSHDEARKKICCCCGSKKKKMLLITSCTEDLVRKFAHPQYDSSVLSYPVGLCSWCRVGLFKLNKDEVFIGSSQWEEFNLEDLNVPRGQPCDCGMCRTVKFNPIGSSAPKKVLDATKKVFALEDEQNASVTPNQKAKRKICAHCLQTTGKGIPHNCSPGARKFNLVGIIEEELPPAQEQVVSAGIKTIMAMKQVRQGEKLSMKNLKGGNNLTVRVGAATPSLSSAPLSSNFIGQIQKKLDLSSRKTELLCKALRDEHVKVEKNTRESLIHKGRELEDFYDLKTVPMEVAEKTKLTLVEKDVVFLKNLPSFVQHIMEVRRLEPEKTIVRTQIDGGGGSVKVTASIFQPTLLSYDNTDRSNGVTGERYSGVNKLLVLAHVDNIQERYENIRTLVELVKLNQLKTFIAADLKLINVLLGISSHSGKFSCAWCESECTLSSGKLRTFGNIQQHYQDFVDAGANLKNMMAFKNVIHSCLLEYDDEQLVLDVIPPPELHLLMGVVNKILDLVIKVWPEVLDWCRSKGITRHGYQGGGLDGNNSKKLLDKLDELSAIIPIHLLPIVSTLKDFKEIVAGCFGDYLCPLIVSKIESFSKSYVNLREFSADVLNERLTVSWKVHVVVVHLPQFLKKKKVGMARFAEQTGEAAHAKMKGTLKRFCVCEDNPRHGMQMKKAIVNFSSNNQ